MLYPSIDELVKKVEASIRWSWLLLAVRASRDGEKCLVKEPKSKKDVGVALEEIYEDLVQFEKPE